MGRDELSWQPADKALNKSSLEGQEFLKLNMAGYDTNLAAEFHVLSVLHRLGADATLTMANKKSVDIVVIRGAGDAVTIDVKGLAGMTSWPVDNFRKGRKKHYLVLVSFLEKISDVTVPPEVYIIPAKDIEPFIYSNPNKTRRVIPLHRARKNGGKYRDAWKQLLPEL